MSVLGGVMNDCRRRRQVTGVARKAVRQLRLQRVVVLGGRSIYSVVGTEYSWLQPINCVRVDL